MISILRMAHKRIATVFVINQLRVVKIYDCAETTLKRRERLRTKKYSSVRSSDSSGCSIIRSIDRSLTVLKIQAVPVSIFLIFSTTGRVCYRTVRCLVRAVTGRTSGGRVENVHRRRRRHNARRRRSIVLCPWYRGRRAGR